MTFSWSAYAADPEALDRELVACGRDVAALDELRAAQLAWSPTERAWSVTQCVEHLAESTRLYCEEMSLAIATAGKTAKPNRPAIKPGAPSRWFLDELASPGRRRLRAPTAIVPRSGRTWSEVSRDYAVHHERALRLRQESATLDLNRIRFRNPFLPLIRFTLGVGFLAMVTHDRRHLEQIRRLSEHPDFPSS
jgi:hypothetical protein